MNTNRHFQIVLALSAGFSLLWAGPPTQAWVAASQPGLRAPARPVSIFGFVNFADGSPAVGRLVTAARGHRSHLVVGKDSWARVNNEGAFALNGGLLAPGKCVFRVAGTSVNLNLSATRRPYDVLYFTLGTGRVTVSSPFVAPASRRTVIFGVVTRPDGRTPVPLPIHVAITVSRDSKGAKKAEAPESVGASGTFVLPQPLSPGNYSVAATDKYGSIVARKHFIVPRTQPAYLVLVVKAATGSMCGHVLDNKGGPIEKGTVGLINESRYLSYGAITGKDGYYALKHLLPGQYIVEASSNPASLADFKSMEGVVVIKDGKLAKDFTVWGMRAPFPKGKGNLPAPKAADATISGQVLDAAGHPVATGLVMLVGVPQPQGPTYSTITDRNGHYLIKHILPGQYIATPTSNPTDRAHLESTIEVVVIKDGKQKTDFKLRRKPGFFQRQIDDWHHDAKYFK